MNFDRPRPDLMRNVEIKARVKDLDVLIKTAETVSKSGGTIIKQEDTFFKVPQGRLKIRKFEQGHGELIYYERPDVEGPKMSAYKMLSLSREQLESLHNIMIEAFGVTGYVKKVRRLFLVGQTRVHVDSVEDLGDFAELEVVLWDNQSPEDGEKVALSLMEQLGIEKEDLVAGAYTDLLNKAK